MKTFLKRITVAWLLLAGCTLGAPAFAAAPAQVLQATAQTVQASRQADLKLAWDRVGSPVRPIA